MFKDALREQYIARFSHDKAYLNEKLDKVDGYTEGCALIQFFNLDGEGRHLYAKSVNLTIPQITLIADEYRDHCCSTFFPTPLEEWLLEKEYLDIT